MRAKEDEKMRGTGTTSEPFRLDKWYLDCVSPTGQVFIGYFAKLHWRGLALSYAGTVTTGTRFTLRPGLGPDWDEDQVRWQCPALGVEGRWDRCGAPVHRKLLESPEGAIDWHCHLPRARVRLRCQDEWLEGLGYGEFLSMTIRPWRLPVKELHWGRFLGGDRSVVWIRWIGPQPLDLLLDGGDAAVSPSIAGRSLAWGPHTSLQLQPMRTLREGSLGETVLGSIPILSSLLPAAILNTREDKWLSWGTLHPPQGDPISGFALHEVVRFPGESA